MIVLQSNAGMAQSVEQFTRNEQVISSNLITSSKKMTEGISVIFLSKPKYN